ncbi:MAG: MBL fold metallo-hydrolase [Flavobacteriaceae bacterium]|nr:MBL fold metallo-hydrolase [Flavobacteriaceae bacterium]
MKTKLIFLFFSIVFFICKDKKNDKLESKTADKIEVKSEMVKISPISHATAVLEFKNQIIYIDPTGGKKAFENFKSPDFVVITDIHGDHMNLKTLNELDLSKSTVIAPEAVAKEITTVNTKEIVVINNGESKKFTDFSIEAIPMYNLREEALKFHTKGRGNGYIFTINDERIYFSGDTEDIPEMRNLNNIDKAFVCMNLPYTMTIDSAADAVLAFKPNQVYPYHYRGTGGLSDVAKFKEIVNKGNPNIEVVQLNWYPN